MDHLKATVKRWGKEVYLAEIDCQWAEKAVSGLKDERLTPTLHWQACEVSSGCFWTGA